MEEEETYHAQGPTIPAILVAGIHVQQVLANLREHQRLQTKNESVNDCLITRTSTIIVDCGDNTLTIQVSLMPNECTPLSAAVLSFLLLTS